MANENITYNLNINTENSVNSISSLEMNLDELKSKIKNVEVGSREFKNLQREIVKADSKLKNVNKSIEGMDFEQVAGEVGKFAGGIGGVTAALTIMGGEGNETLEEMQKNLNQGLALFMGIKGAVEVYTASIKLAKLAQIQLNAAMKANPIGVITAGVVLLTAAVWGLAEAYKGVSDEQKLQEEMQETYFKNQEEWLKNNSDINKSNDEYIRKLAIINKLENDSNTTATMKITLDKEKIQIAEELNKKYSDQTGVVFNASDSIDIFTNKMNKATAVMVQNTNLVETNNNLKEIYNKKAEAELNLTQAQNELSEIKNNISQKSLKIIENLSDEEYTRLKTGDRQLMLIKDLSNEDLRNINLMSKKSVEVKQYQSRLDAVNNELDKNNENLKNQYLQYLRERKVVEGNNKAYDERIERIRKIVELSNKGRDAALLEKEAQEQTNKAAADARKSWKDTKSQAEEDLKLQLDINKQRYVGEELRKADVKSKIDYYNTLFNTDKDYFEREVTLYQVKWKELSDGTREAYIDSTNIAREKTQDEYKILLDHKKDVADLELYEELVEGMKSAEDEIAEILKQMAEDQLKMINDSTTATQKAINSAIEATKKQQDLIKDGIKETVGYISDMYYALNESQNNATEKRIEKLEQERDAELAAADARIGIYKNAKTEQQIIDDKYNAMIEAEQKKQFEKDKDFNIGEVFMNTALGISDIWSKYASVPILAAALSAIMVGVGATQVASIQSQTYADGGLLVGPSHAMGGIATPFGEMEGGEAIINKRSTERFAPVLSAVNQAEGGRPIGNSSDISGFMKPQKVYVVSSEITDQQYIDVKVKDRTKI